MRRPSSTRRDPLDLTPILGLVAILIPMLLMAYLPHALATIETRVPAMCASCTDTDEAVPVVPTVHVTEQGLRLEQVVVTSGTDPDALELPCADTCRHAGDYDWAGLQEALATTRTETTGTGGVTIIVSDVVAYEVLVETMDACRERVHEDGTREPLYPHPTLGAAG